MSLRKKNRLRYFIKFYINLKHDVTTKSELTLGSIVLDLVLELFSRHGQYATEVRATAQ